MLDWKDLIAERNEWIAHNFPSDTLIDSIMGVQEEMGELAHAHLKMKQNIRGNHNDHVAEGQDAVGDLIVYLLGVMNKWGGRHLYSMNLRAPSSPDRLILTLGSSVGGLCGAFLLGNVKLGVASTELIVTNSMKYCKEQEWNFDEIVLNTWASVKKRDWIRWPKTGIPSTVSLLQGDQIEGD